MMNVQQNEKGLAACLQKAQMNEQKMSEKCCEIVVRLCLLHV